MAPLAPRPLVPARDSTTVLRNMGLDADVLLRALETGASASRSITAFHPVTAAGYTLWAESVAALRERLVEKGWTLSDAQNAPRIVRPDKKVEIILAGGDDQTGVSVGVPPRFARRRGTAMEAAVSANRFGQGVLDIPLEGTQRLTWILLYRLDAESGQMFAELSLPARTEEGNVTEWASRILLPSAEFRLKSSESNLPSADEDVLFTLDLHARDA